jgi:hypothetical protein
MKVVQFYGDGGRAVLMAALVKAMFESLLEKAPKKAPVATFGPIFICFSNLRRTLLHFVGRCPRGKI